MNNTIYIVVAVIIMLFLKIKSRGGQMDYKEAVEKIEKGAVLIDVRESDEYNSGHAKGAINISVKEIQKAEDVVKDKNQEVVLYCRSGARAAKAKKDMTNLGYKNVYVLGGLEDWKGQVE